MRFIVRTALGCLLVLVGLVSTSPGRVAAQTDVPKDLQPLQGTWVTASVDGQQIPDTNPEVDFVVDGNKYSQVLGSKVIERGEIRVDATKTPATIDFFIKEGDDANKAQFGIFKIEGAGLTMKLNRPAEPTRPTDFSVQDGFTVFVLTKKPK